MGLLLAIYLMLSGDLTSAYFFDSQGHGNSAGLVFGISWSYQPYYILRFMETPQKLVY